MFVLKRNVQSPRNFHDKIKVVEVHAKELVIVAYCNAEKRGIHSRKPITWEAKENGCWECTSHAPTGMYPKIRRKGFLIRRTCIHRLIYEECFGEIPDGMVICHKCDNTLCINPEHLFLGTYSDNMQDMIQKGRGNYLKGEHKTNAKLKEREVIEIIRRSRNGEKTGELAKEYNVDDSTISKIKNGIKWSYLKEVV